MPNNASDSISKASVQHELDATGLYCPEPVMLLHNRIRDMQPGEICASPLTDPSTSRDVPKFCLYLEHELVASAQRGDEFLYLIRKPRLPPEPQRKHHFRHVCLGEGDGAAGRGCHLNLSANIASTA